MKIDNREERLHGLGEDENVWRINCTKSLDFGRDEQNGVFQGSIQRSQNRRRGNMQTLDEIDDSDSSNSTGTASPPNSWGSIPY